MFVPLGKTAFTPWQKDSPCANSVRGIRIDNMDVTYGNKKQYYTIRPVL